MLCSYHSFIWECKLEGRRVLKIRNRSVWWGNERHMCKLGIEDARQSIHDKLNEMMDFSGIYINHHHTSFNYHHTSSQCDRMTRNKNMVPIYFILPKSVG